MKIMMALVLEWVVEVLWGRMVEVLAEIIRGGDAGEVVLVYTVGKRLR